MVERYLMILKLNANKVEEGLLALGLDTRLQQPFLLAIIRLAPLMNERKIVSGLGQKVVSVVE